MDTQKPLEFLGSSRSDLRDLPAEVRHAMGLELLSIQQGGLPLDFKSMRSVGKGVYEIRINLGGAWRLLYVAKFSEAIYVLHTFQKKTQQTSKEHIDLARKRYRMIGG
ncbi:MAG TPA: type II toxin-antitoxin system RelE/ParE family toxin [Acidobacteriaceae bacterium]